MSATTARNVAIILLLAAVVTFVPGGGTAADAILALMSIVFFGGLAWFVARLYLEHRATIFGLGDRVRGLLYGAIGVVVVTVTATARLWDTGGGTLLWFLLVGGASYALFAVYRSSQQYS